MIFDTHAHYDDEQFDADREGLLNSMQEGGVGTIVNISASYDSCRNVVELAGRYPFMYAAVGIHPDHVGSLDEKVFDEMEGLMDNEKVVAVGEIGLDYYWDNESHDLQRKWFIRQLELARRHNLPVVIHSRDAAEDTLEVIKEHAQGLKGVIHCFSYSRELAREYIKMGFYIGVGGVVTFKNAKKLKEVVEETPLTSIVLETDCPYLAPEPYRGKRNNSLYIRYVAEAIARIKNVDYDTVVGQTEANAIELYGISDNFVV
ncbi:hydrolase TatD [Lachnospiraceae bacterium]|uniref:TatD family hydrolase n=1 Tax=Extibacter sp. GGCC_0201 TaxID=2731209 RepID=UPI001AA0E379|nr:TatD family hydrolase [Extibacter sp. GGCC_0201]MBO1720945.1 TatD family hydrolase [Extibacter sp. GGCC_0201]BDF31995.1 hydrolase TatD [Lachnospiraceae bacterium]BDF36008.1 hydrolase TatD [Lachnospiraceae bacterium]